MTKREFKTIRKKHGIPKGSRYEDMGIAMTVIQSDGRCGYFSDNKCSIYDDRPNACKRYGVDERQPCQYLYPEKAVALAKEMARRLPMFGNENVVGKV